MNNITCSCGHGTYDDGNRPFFGCSRSTDYALINSSAISLKSIDEQGVHRSIIKQDFPFDILACHFLDLLDGMDLDYLGVYTCIACADTVPYRHCRHIDRTAFMQVYAESF